MVPPTAIRPDDSSRDSYFDGCSQQHLDAVNRNRRVIMNDDGLSRFYELGPARGQPDLEHVKHHMHVILDIEDSQIDSVFWSWGAGNWAPYPSEIPPIRRGHAAFGWLRENTDVMRVCLEETHRRGLEAFYSHRINAAENHEVMKCNT